jgi:hypothetical protein
MKIIIVNGAAKNGKDKFVNFCIKNHTNSVNWSTIDTVKKISKRNFGWDGKKTDEARKFLSDIKRIWSEYNNGPFSSMIDKIAKHYKKLTPIDKLDAIYFIHCREPHEIKKFVDYYKDDCITVLLNRDDREVPNNDSDMNVANYDYDYYIENDGNVKDLEEKAIEFLNKILKNEES